MTAQDLLAELETMMNRLDAMSDDGFFTPGQQALLEDAARRVDVVLQDAWDNA